MRKESRIVKIVVLLVSIFLCLALLLLYWHIQEKNYSGTSEYVVDKIVDATNYSELKGAIQSEYALDGSSITFVDEGGWIKYSSFDFEDGEANMFMAVVSSVNDSRLELYIDNPQGESIGTLEISSTNGFFKECYAEISKTVSGVHDFYICNKGGMPINMDVFILSSYSGFETDEERDERMSWWREARYGQFIHFGAYANFPFQEDFQGLGEWVMWYNQLSSVEYEELAVKSFNPANFDAKEIVKNAYDAGANYIVFTSKHHEGFSMFDTDVEGFAPFDIIDYGTYSGRDPILSLSEECRKSGIRFGCYYSILDWHHSEQSEMGTKINNKEAYLEGMKAQLRELIQNYDVDILWFDGEWVDWWTSDDGDMLYHYLRTLKPSIIVNNRVGKRLPDEGDFGTPEQIVPEMGSTFDWESCIPMNDSWGYVPHDTNWKSSKWIIETLVSTASKGGNMLLNVGPDNTGRVPEECLSILSDAGKWINQYGDSIFDTTSSPFNISLDFGAATKKDGYLYLHILDYPEGQCINIPAIENEIKSVSLMGNSSSEKLEYTISDKEVRITLPAKPENEFDTVIIIETDGIPMQRVVH